MLGVIPGYVAVGTPHALALWPARSVWELPHEWYLTLLEMWNSGRLDEMERQEREAGVIRFVVSEE